MRTLILALLLAASSTVEAAGNPWTATMVNEPRTDCLTAASVPVACADGSATQRRIIYDIRNPQGQLIESVTLVVPKAMAAQAIRNTVRHRVHSLKYPPPGGGVPGQNDVLEHAD